MSYTVKKLEKSRAEFSITVTPAEYAREVEKATQRLSERVAIQGFRKGHVPTDILRKQVGDMAILQEALEDIIRSSFYRAVSEEKIETIGMPKVDIEKLAPQNDVVYKATVALLPPVVVSDLSKIHVKKQNATIDEKQIDETIHALRSMQATEALKNAPATTSDKIVIDMNMTLDNVPVDGGQAKDYGVYLSEEHYIPGFNEQLLGLKAGDEKTFSLTFPTTHYQKMLAGKSVAFSVTVKGVFERTLPEADDAFASRLGQKTFADLAALVRKNREEEAQQKASEKMEIEILEKLVHASTIGDIPEELIDAEKEKMFYELKRDLERNGVSIEDYLRDIKKKEDELFRDFQQQAEQRVKASLLSRELAKQHGLAPTEDEINAELDLMRNAYKHDKEFLQKMEQPGVRDSIAAVVQNKKVMAFLSKTINHE